MSMLGSAARTALVLYGSETGNAQDLAEELGRVAHRLLFSVQVLPLDSVRPENLNDYTVILIAISTTGQGDLPANAKGFWRRLLRKRLPANHLQKSKFALFGLGDSSYPQYNWAALKLGKRLQQLGACEIVPWAEGDEQHPEGVDAAFVPWLQTLRKKLIDNLPVPEGQSIIADDVLLQPPWLLGQSAASDVADQGHQVNGANTVPVDPANSQLQHSEGLHEVVLVRNERLTSPDHFQDVRRFALTCRERLSYMPGDVLTIFPRNHPDDVEQLLRIMRWQDQADILVDSAPNPAYTGSRAFAGPPPMSSKVAPGSITFREFVSTRLDINAIPRRSFFSLVSHFTTDEFQRDRLLEFANPEFVDELFDYTTRPRRSILEVLQEFDTLKIPWQWAAAVLPQLRGRQFSIASGGALKESSGQLDPDDAMKDPAGTTFELLVAIVKYRTVIKKIRRGVCTRYLEGLAPGARLEVTLQKGTLGAEPNDLDRPVILIGPGTGLAPLRALIWERWAWQESYRLQTQQSSSKPFRGHGPSLLFFGCRSRQADYFFEDEWATLRSLGMPLSIFTAFSRDQDQKVYVQDRIAEEYKLVYKCMFERDGLVYVCGSSGKMPQAVRGALMDVIQKGGGFSPDDAEQELKKLEKAGRYKQETW